MWAVLLALLLVSCYVDSSGSRQLRQEEAADDGCSTLFGDFRGVTVIMTADQNVALRGMLQDSYVPPPGQALCAALAGGQLLGSPVLLVATGPGDLPSGICSTFLLQACSNRIKDIISLGAADTSPQRGGVLNSGETQCLEPNADTQDLVRLGDICVASLAVSTSCRSDTWQRPCGWEPDSCLVGQMPPPAAALLLEECSFCSYAQGSQELAEEVIQAASAALGTYPAPSAALLQLQADFWSGMAEGTGLDYPFDASSASQPAIWGPDTCADSGRFLESLYTGLSFDIQAREAVAVGLQIDGNASVTASDVIAVSAMEGGGLSRAMQLYMSAPTARQIPFTIVRAASGLLHGPVLRHSNGTWSSAAWSGLPEGREHALATGGHVILNLLRERCLRAGGDQALCSLP